MKKQLNGFSEKTIKTQNLHLFYLFIIILALVLTFINPYNRVVWFLEVFPVFIGLLILIPTYNRFRLTNLSYTIIFIHCLILIWGGYHTYSRNPLFDYLKELFDLQRNHYDRLGHLYQGITPAILGREILLRKTPLRDDGWLFFIVVSISLATSAFYEFIEWWVALISKTSAEEFLATQGDIWDTQWDMFLAFLGSILAQLLFRRYHKVQLNNFI
ncbi:MAG: DUF2238 domain-containing protein [Proteobacteria bacterium]|nr:DUF2238 domain-containing protein [Pseudomonadota bacterium]